MERQLCSLPYKSVVAARPKTTHLTVPNRCTYPDDSVLSLSRSHDRRCSRETTARPSKRIWGESVKRKTAHHRMWSGR